MLILSVTIAFLTLGVLWLAAILNEHDMHPMRRLAELMKRPAAEIALVALVAIGMIHHGATKGTNGVNGAGGEMGGTNGVQNMGGVLTGLMGLPGFGDGGGQGLPALPTTNYQLPTTNLDWLAFGGYEDWFYLDGGGWCFRFGSNLVERLTVFSCGEISPAPYDESNRISLLGLPLAILPAANWHLLGNGDQGTGNGEQGTGNCQLPTTNYQLKSLFCHEETPSNTLLLTWQNALVNRDTNLPVTVQAELFPNGAAAFRYDFSGIGDISALSNAEAQIWRDGVAETGALMTGAVTLVEFAAPAIAGTNALDEVYARIAGGNTNAYYCADVVVEKGPAKIRVEPMADETNRGLLGAYEIVAMPGETNRLPLLIGPKYAVSAETAFGAFGLVPPPFVPLADDTGTVERLEFGEAFSATNVTDRLVEVQWPVEFAREEIDATPEATTYALRVTPDWLDGEVTWHGIADTNAPPMRGAPPMRSGGDSCSCGCLVRDGLDLIHSQTCSCEHCSAEGECSYEGHSENISIDVKDSNSGGGGNSPGGGNANQPDPDLPSVSVSFDKDVLIFEAPYEVEPGIVTNPPPSTRTKLTLHAYGGENGGTLQLILGSELKMVSGSDPMPSSVPPYESVEWEGYCEATNASPNIRGTVTKAKIIENLTGNEVKSRAKRVTAVRITVEPENLAPENKARGRHALGVCEVVHCTQSPAAPLVTWMACHGAISNRVNGTSYICPLYGASDPLRAIIGDVDFTPRLSVLAPRGIEARNERTTGYGRMEGLAGYIGMAFELYVLPLTVSFQNIAVEEVPNELGGPSGYFTNAYFSAYWHHNRDCGAGRWRKINDNNYFMTDIPAVSISLPRMRADGTLVHSNDTTVGWQDGQLIWEDPFGWNVTNVSETASEYGTFATGTRQETVVTSDGTVTLRKFGNEAVRGTNGIPFLNGVMQNVDE